MNIRIAKKKIRFRLDMAEAKQLLERDALQRLTEILKLPGGQEFKYGVHLFSDLDEMKLDVRDGTWVLNVPFPVFKDLVLSSPSKEGIEAQVGELRVSLEIDISKKPQ